MRGFYQLLGLIYFIFTILVSAQIEKTIVTSKDCFTHNAILTTNQNGPMLLVENKSGDRGMSFVYFDISSIPTNATINLANLKLYTNTVEAYSEIRISIASTQWSETGITYSNMPTSSNFPPPIYKPIQEAGKYGTYNVTEFVKYWFQNPSKNFGFKIDESTYGGATFWAREYGSSRAPLLEIQYSLPPEIDITNPTSSSNWQKGLTYQIKWEDNIEEKVKIILNYSNLFDEISANTSSDGRYNWTVPDYLENRNDYQIYIVSTANSSIYDLSDKFTISSSSHPPNKPELLSPENNFQFNYPRTLTFSWECSDPDGDALEYYLCVREEGEISFERVSVGNKKSFDVDGLDEGVNGTYEWFVEATDGVYQTQSDIYKFVIDIGNNPDINLYPFHLIIRQ